MNVIVNELKAVAEKENVEILYACESGSRSWGFASKNSDYDVRFIFKRKIDSYLSVRQEGKENIEFKKDLLDVVGWDIRKTLRLMVAGNVTPLEWLYADTKYYVNEWVLEEMFRLSKEYFSPYASVAHYLGMATQNFKKYLGGEEVELKKYLYVIRPVLAAQWIKQFDTIPPLNIDVLFMAWTGNEESEREANVLIKQKRQGLEKDLGARLPNLHKYLESELANSQWKNDLRKPEVDMESCDKFFRKLIL